MRLEEIIVVGKKDNIRVLLRNGSILVLGLVFIATLWYSLSPLLSIWVLIPIAGVASFSIGLLKLSNCHNKVGGSQDLLQDTADSGWESFVKFFMLNAWISYGVATMLLVGVACLSILFIVLLHKHLVVTLGFVGLYCVWRTVLEVRSTKTKQ